MTITPSPTATDSIVAYKDIPDAPGYRVGDDGSVWSCLNSKGQATSNWKLLTLRPIYDRRMARASIIVSGKMKSVKVADMILGLFVGPCPDGFEASHLDGNRANLRLANLKWASRIETRFWAKIKEVPSGCHEWQGYVSDTGYGTITMGKKLFSTHRFAYISGVGPIPDGLHVLHRCDNRICCRVDHLFLGTACDNAQDMTQKGRRRGGRGPAVTRRGEKSKFAKLTDVKVAEIRDRYAAGNITLKEISNEYGITRTAASYVIRRKTWAHIA